MRPPAFQIIIQTRNRKKFNSDFNSYNTLTLKYVWAGKLFSSTRVNWWKSLKKCNSKSSIVLENKPFSCNLLKSTVIWFYLYLALKRVYFLFSAIFKHNHNKHFNTIYTPFGINLSEVNINEKQLLSQNNLFSFWKCNCVMMVVGR